MTSHMMDDDYEGDDDILDLPLASIPSMDGIAVPGSSNERLIRKRSSKGAPTSGGGGLGGPLASAFHVVLTTAYDLSLNSVRQLP